MKRYRAFTLLELIIVMVIMFTLSLVSIISYRSLVDSFSMNEVSLTIAQDIRSAQRAAMMLDRDGNERWLHGIGLDFGDINEHRQYKIFKWCSAFDFYDALDPVKANLTNEVPNLSPGDFVINARISDGIAEHCDRNIPGSEDEILITEIKTFAEHNNLNFNLPEHFPVQYILFEAVSGKAFFYDSERKLLNYSQVGGEIVLDPAHTIKRFELIIDPIRKEGLTTRTVKVNPVSGIVFFEYD